MVHNLVEDSGCEKTDAEIVIHDVSEENHHCKDEIDSHRFEDTVQNFDVNYCGTDSNFEGTCQENLIWFKWMLTLTM